MRVVALLIAIAAPLTAQQMPKEVPGKPEVARVTAGTYAVDSGHTQILYTVNHLGFSDYTGQFVEPTGTLTIDPRNAAATKLDITIPIAKQQSTVKALDDHLMKPDFFDVAKYPTARFVSTKVEFSGRRAVIAGNLTLHGVTKPVVLSTEFVGAGPNPMSKKLNFGFHATAKLNRSDYGIGYGVPMVSDLVRLEINAAFEAR